MTQRLVKGKISRPDIGWNDARIVFTLMSGSFNPTTQYPGSRAIARANALGEFAVSLWANEEGEIPSIYSCDLPGEDEPFEFTIPAGTGELELSVLRESGSVAPGSPQWTSILTLVEERIQDVIDNGNIIYSDSHQQVFTQANLSIAGLIPITYPVAIPASGLVVFDNQGNPVNPDHWRSLSPTTVEINLESFVPIVGTWQASISL